MTTGRLRLRDIREHEGSQARAWEELAFQVRPDGGAGWVECRKTRAPDGGVEWYELYDDGHQVGFQAKFNENLESALGGMAESVRAVASKRPQMTKLVFVVPYDFTDAAKPRSKSDQQRWDDAVARWRTDIPGGDRLTYEVIRAGDVVAELTRANHAGRRAYWFGEVELTEQWLERRWAEAVSVAGERYTPAADTESRVNFALDAVGATPAFFERVGSLTDRVLKACRKDRGIWGEEVSTANTLLQRIETGTGSAFSEPGTNDMTITPIDFSALDQAATALVDLAVTRTSVMSASSGETILDEALSAASDLRNFARSADATVYVARSIAVEGVAGQGKTHALMKLAQTLLDNDTPAVILLGQQLREGNWWPAACGALGSPPARSADEFLDALDSLAEAKGHRAVIIIDALNEAQDPRMWRTELPSMLAQVESRKHLALVVSYRTDYRETISPPTVLVRIKHPGLAGREQEALDAYCLLFGIRVPPAAALDSSFSSPLFLRMYCAVVAGDALPGTQAPTRSTIFGKFANLQGERIRDALRLSPTSNVVRLALAAVSDLLLGNEGQAVPRAQMETSIDRLLPGRVWPNTLFQQLVSEGLLEVRPGFDAIEVVAFPFQAYSEQLLATRVLEADEDSPRPFAILSRLRITSPTLSRSLRRALQQKRWLWRSMAVLLPEVRGIELVDVLPKSSADDRMLAAMRESLTDRSQTSFSNRALCLLEGELKLSASDWVEIVLTLAPRDSHPANADWLHARLLAASMPDRDATWSIDTFDVDASSVAFERLLGWADRDVEATAEQARLASLTLMWLLTSPNRFLRDRASRSVVAILTRHLDQAPSLLDVARSVDDTYVQERVLTCVYGAVVVAGGSDADAVHRVTVALRKWAMSGLPVHAVARDSARGIASWAHGHGIGLAGLLKDVSPPYGAAPPEEPPTADDLEAKHGYIKNGAGEYLEWRASTILMSCLDWMGDFNKYVVRSDVGFFSRRPLSEPPLTGKNGANEVEFEADWAGRWIAHRAIEFGWTAERFETFESNNNRRDGREGHKAERFGKKYQWIAHQELLARLADNFHPARQPWDRAPKSYEGPWPWYGRDFDPTLPPARRVNGRGVCIVESNAERWAALPSPDMSTPSDPNFWVGRTTDLPTAEQMFVAVDEEDRDWIVLSRYSSWDRDNAERRGVTNRELDIFFLQFSWLTAAGEGRRLHDLVMERGLGGRWMPERKRPHTQYLGEQSWSPIVQQSLLEPDADQPERLSAAGISARPAVETYLWEGNVLDCSIDESVDLHAPCPELLGEAEWVGFLAQWKSGARTIAKSVHIDDGENGQDALIVDREWLEARLVQMGAELVIGTLSEKHALLDEVDDRRMAFSDIWYSAHLSPGEVDLVEGPVLKVRTQG